MTDDENNHDINSVAGVLKLYFRGLEKSLLPKERFNDLLSCVSKFLCSTLSLDQHSWGCYIIINTSKACTSTHTDVRTTAKLNLMSTYSMEVYTL